MKRNKKRNLWQRLAIDIGGFGLLILAVLIAPIPGPGGIPIFIAGLGVLSLNYDWAKHLLVDFEKKRSSLVEKYLVNHKIITTSIDIFGSAIIISAPFVFFNTDNPVLRAVMIMLFCLAIVLILSNKRRIDRFMVSYRKKRDKLLKP